MAGRNRPTITRIKQTFENGQPPEALVAIRKWKEETEGNDRPVTEPLGSPSQTARSPTPGGGGGYALVEVASKKEAIDLATRFMEIHLRHWPVFEGACEVRPIDGEASPAPGATAGAEAASF